MDSELERIGENISVAKNSVVRPRDLRTSKAKSRTSFSRASTARASLGATSFAWMDAADRLETDALAITHLPFTRSRRNKLSLMRDDELVMEYDKNLLKIARVVFCEGPISLEQSDYLFQAVFDKNLERYWGLRITNVDSSLKNQFPLKMDEFIVRVNEESFFSKSSIELLLVLVNAFSKPQTTMISSLRKEDLPFSLPRTKSLSAVKESPTYGSAIRSELSPVSYIKNLNAFNTRSIGQRVTVDLHKLSEGGFGISFATRDTLVNSEDMQPVFVERIMPVGAAIHDGRIQFGDRLLSINGIQVNNFKKAMATLRSVPVGEKAILVFSRQATVVAMSPSASSDWPPGLPNNSSSTRASNTATPILAFESPLCQTIVCNVPIPHPNSASANLGIQFEMWPEPRIIHSYSKIRGSEVNNYRMVGDSDEFEESLSGLYVKQISADSPAHRSLPSGNIKPGDRLIAVNNHSIIGLSLADISNRLKRSIGKAQDKMIRKKEQVYLKLTVNRFFHCPDKMDSYSKTNVLTEDKTEIPLRRLIRTPSLDSRVRSRRELGSRSPSDSPVRCQSAFTRDGVGRRSVSEKRHAHTNATDIFHCNDSAMPLRINVDDEVTRLYSTMPASRKIRQIRRSKQGRASGPVKPVHSGELERPSNSAKISMAPNLSGNLSQKCQEPDNDVLRTDGNNELKESERSPPSGLSQSRSYNHSFRAAVNPGSHHTAFSPPPTSPKPIFNSDHSEEIHREFTPLVSTRHSKVGPNTVDLRSLPSPSSSTATMQQKAFEEFTQRPGNKMDAVCMFTSRRESFYEKENTSDMSNIKLLPDSEKSVVLTGVTPLPCELRRTPSPAKFNSYEVEQTECINFPDRAKPSANFLEEVEISLPKRHVSQVADALQVEEPPSDPKSTFSRGTHSDSSPSIHLHNGYTTIPKMTKQKSPFFLIDPIGLETNIDTAKPQTPRLNAHDTMMKSRSPHAIVRSRSPPVVHVKDARSNYHRLASHSLTRRIAIPPTLQRQSNLKSRGLNQEPSKFNTYQATKPEIVDIGHGAGAFSISPLRKHPSGLRTPPALTAEQGHQVLSKIPTSVNSHELQSDPPY